MRLDDTPSTPKPHPHLALSAADSGEDGLPLKLERNAGRVAAKAIFRAGSFIDIRVGKARGREGFVC